MLKLNNYERLTIRLQITMRYFIYADGLQEICDFMDRQNQEIEHIVKVAFMSKVHVEGKTMRYNEVPTVEERQIEKYRKNTEFYTLKG